MRAKIEGNIITTYPNGKLSLVMSICMLVVFIFLIPLFSSVGKFLPLLAVMLPLVLIVLWSLASYHKKVVFDLTAKTMTVKHFFGQRQYQFADLDRVCRVNNISTQQDYFMITTREHRYGGGIRILPLICKKSEYNAFATQVVPVLQNAIERNDDYTSQTIDNLTASMGDKKYYKLAEDGAYYHIDVNYFIIILGLALTGFGLYYTSDVKWNDLGNYMKYDKNFWLYPLSLFSGLFMLTRGVAKVEIQPAEFKMSVSFMGGLLNRSYELIKPLKLTAQAQLKNGRYESTDVLIGVNHKKGWIILRNFTNSRKVEDFLLETRALFH